MIKNTDKIYFPIKVSKDKKKGNKAVIEVIKADTYELIKMSVEDTQKIKDKSSLNYNTLKYSEDDKESIVDCNRVLIYEDVENNLYGVVAFTTFLQLWWIPKRLIDERTEDVKILNIDKKAELFKVDSNFIASYKSTGGIKVYRSNCLKFTFKYALSVEEFSKQIKANNKTVEAERLANKFKIETRHVKEKQVVKEAKVEEKVTPKPVETKPVETKTDTENKRVTPVIKEAKAEEKVKDKQVVKETKSEEISDKTVVKEEKQTEKVSENKENKENNINNVCSEILTNKLNEIIQKEIELENKRKDLEYKEEFLDNREKELNSREYNLLREDQINNEFELVEAEVVVDGKDTKSSSELKMMYELLLKILKRGDSITIPSDVFNQFKVSVKSKALDRNSAYTKYTQIALIRTNNAQSEGVLAIIEVDEDKPVRVSILGEYGVQLISASIIQKYESEYRQWRKDRYTIR